MNPWAVIGLPIAFAVLAALLLWLVIDKRVAFPFKIALIAGVVWYGLVLYHAPSGILGWPKPNLPDCAVVLSFKVIEPSVNIEEAGIYMWAVPKKMGEEKKDFLEAWRVFKHTHKNVPRSYKMPYDEKMHKELSEADAEAKGVNGLVMFKKPKGKFKKGKGRPTPHDYEDDSGFSIIDPTQVFKKGEQAE